MVFMMLFFSTNSWMECLCSTCSSEVNQVFRRHFYYHHFYPLRCIENGLPCHCCPPAQIILHKILSISWRKTIVLGGTISWKGCKCVKDLFFLALFVQWVPNWILTGSWTTSGRMILGNAVKKQLWTLSAELCVCVLLLQHQSPIVLSGLQFKYLSK